MLAAAAARGAIECLAYSVDSIQVLVNNTAWPRAGLPGGRGGAGGRAGRAEGARGLAAAATRDAVGGLACSARGADGGGRAVGHARHGAGGELRRADGRVPAAARGAAHGRSRSPTYHSQLLCRRRTDTTAKHVDALRLGVQATAWNCAGSMSPSNDNPSRHWSASYTLTKNISDLQPKA